MVELVKALEAYIRQEGLDPNSLIYLIVDTSAQLAFCQGRDKTHRCPNGKVSSAGDF